MAPRLCISCGSPATRAWLTADIDKPGVAWCADCLGDWCLGECWALLPAELLPSRLLERREFLLLERAPPVTPGEWERSPYSACPLCGLGEAGAEHLTSWCPVAAEAWSIWAGPSAPPLLQALLKPEGLEDRLAPMLHQLAYHHSSLLGRAEWPPSRAAARIVQACACSAVSVPEEEEEARTPS